MYYTNYLSYYMRELHKIKSNMYLERKTLKIFLKICYIGKQLSEFYEYLKKIQAPVLVHLSVLRS